MADPAPPPLTVAELRQLAIGYRALGLPELADYWRRCADVQQFLQAVGIDALRAILAEQQLNDEQSPE